MAYTAEDLRCRCCGFPIEIGMTECPAGHPVNVSTFNSVYGLQLPEVNAYVRSYKKDLQNDPDNQDFNYSIGICYLKLKLYDKALEAFEKAMEDNFDNSETFFYAAVCLLGGKRPFVLMRPTIDKILEYINAALMIEPKGIYYYFMAVVKNDYFSRKFLNNQPDWSACLAMAKQAGLSQFDIVQLYSILGFDRPNGL